MELNIIHIGCPKSGSSFLQKYFTEHPDISIDIDELKDFNFSGVINTEKILNKERAVGKYRVISSENLSVPAFGFFNVDIEYKDFDVNVFRKQIANELYQMFPNAKILMIVRGIETLIPSIYSQYLIIGGTLSFSDFMKKYKETLAILFDYDSIFELYSHFFGQSNILVLPYELLKQNPSNFLEIIESNYGFKHYTFSNTSVNKGVSVKYIPYLLAMSRIARRIIRLLPENKQLKMSYKYSFLIIKLKNKWLHKGKRLYFDDKKMLEETLTLFKSKTIKISNQEHVASFSNLYQP